MIHTSTADAAVKTYTTIIVSCCNNTHTKICTYSTTNYSSIDTTMSNTDDARYILDCCNNTQIQMLILALYYLVLLIISVQVD